MGTKGRLPGMWMYLVPILLLFGDRAGFYVVLLQLRGFGMKLTQGFSAIALLVAATAANAGEFSATVTGTSDYDFRGVTQSAQNPAIQGSVDFAADSGFYAGIWSSNIDFGKGGPNPEVDWYAGWGGGEDLTWDAGITYYTYISPGTSNYPEAHLGFGYKWIDVKAWYGWDYAGYSGKNEHYYEGNVTYPLPAGFGLTGHMGYSNGSGIKAASLNYDPKTDEFVSQGSYMDWSVGVTYSWKHFDMSLKYVDGSDYQTLDHGYYQETSSGDFKKTDVFSSAARAIFQISTTFPWKKEGEE